MPVNNMGVLAKHGMCTGPATLRVTLPLIFLKISMSVMHVQQSTTCCTCRSCYIAVEAPCISSQCQVYHARQQHVHRPSYIEGRLRLAENRERQRGKTAAAGTSSAVDAGSVGQTPEERAAAEKAAEAHARELLQEELAAKASPACVPSSCCLC